MKKGLLFASLVMGMAVVLATAGTAMALENLGFELGTYVDEGSVPDNWVGAPGAGWVAWKTIGGTPHDGTKWTAAGTNDATEATWSQDIPALTAGTNYSLKAWIMTENWGSPTTKLRVAFKDAGGAVLRTDEATVLNGQSAAWTQLSIYTDASPANTVSATISLVGSNGTVYFDDIVFEAASNSTVVSVIIVNPEVSVQVTGTVNLGTVVAGQTAVSASAVTIMNSGTTNATFKLGLTNPAGLTAVNTDAELGVDKFVLNTAFNSDANVTWNTANHHLETVAATCTNTRFAGNQTGVSVAANATRDLWVQFKAPTLVSSPGISSSIVVGVTAIAMP